MKTLMNIAIAAVLVLAFGVAYADDLIAAGKDVGTELYLSENPAIDTMTVLRKDFSSDKPGSDVEMIDVGTALYNSAFGDETMYAGREVTGAGAGGVAPVDERTRIWDHLFGAPGGSDHP